MVQLARCPTLSRLEVLDLSHCSVSDEMGEVLATAEGFTLKELRLAHTGIGARGIQALLESRVARQLELLDLTGCALEGPTRKLLRDRLGDRALV